MNKVVIEQEADIWLVQNWIQSYIYGMRDKQSVLKFQASK